MAGDWIKMREDLHEDEAVLWMAQQLEVRPETVVGYCHRFWGLVSRQTCDGCLTGPTLMSLGSVIGLNGFPELLVEAGWLEHDNSGPKPITRIPHFERHLSEGAKKRALAAARKREERKRNVTQESRTKRDKCRSKSTTRGEMEDVIDIDIYGDIDIDALSDEDREAALARAHAINRVIRPKGSRAKPITEQDRSLIRKTAVLVTAGRLTEDCLAVILETTAKKRANDRVRYFHGAMNHAAQDRGRNFNLMLRSVKDGRLEPADSNGDPPSSPQDERAPPIRSDESS